MHKLIILLMISTHNYHDLDFMSVTFIRLRITNFDLLLYLLQETTFVQDNYVKHTSLFNEPQTFHKNLLYN